MIKNYNSIQKFFHKICFRNKIILKYLYDIEKVFFLKNQNDFKNLEHVFISGLPRSGTTALLNYIYSTNEFASLTYNDMPFLLSPNIYSFLNHKSNIKKYERFHKDGISINLDSPEAFDEVFFSLFESPEYKIELPKYISLILLKYNKSRYLSKNNLNSKRIHLIKKIFPNSIFLVPFRNPYNHSLSLFNQHLNFLSLQNKEVFIKEYMNDLGHNEFGVDHLSWNKPKKYKDITKLNYWLEQWILYYSNILNEYKKFKHFYLLCYEKFESNVQLKKLNDLLNIKDANYKFVNKNQINKQFLGFDDNLLKKANKVYFELINKTY